MLKDRVTERVKSGLGVVAAIVGSLAIGTCAALAQGGAPAKVTVFFPTPPATYLLGFYLAEDQGLYRDAGLAVEFKTVSGDQNALRAVVTGAGDVAVVGNPILYEAVINGAKIKGVGGGNQATIDYYLVLAKGKGTTLKDAAGKTLAISTPGSMPQLLPEMMFRKNGIDSSGTKYVPIGGFAARMQAVVAGKVDGTLTDTLSALRAERAGQVTIVAVASQQLAEPLGYTLSLMSEDGLRDPVRHKALAAFVKATMQGARRIVEQPDAAAQAVFKRLNGDVDLPLLRATIDKLNGEKVWGLNGGVEEKLHEFTMKTYLEYHLISQAVPYATAYDPSLVQEAMKELGPAKGW